MGFIQTSQNQEETKKVYEPMKAIVLTYDKHHAIADHMIFIYSKVWPEHPFTFRIPYQDESALSRSTADDPKKEHIKTPVGMSDTVLGLTEDLDDEEWVYWCLDDRYPISIRNNKLNAIVKWLDSVNPEGVDWVSLFYDDLYMEYSQSTGGKPIYDDNQNSYYLMKSYRKMWEHQFIRVRTLRLMWKLRFTYGLDEQYENFSWPFAEMPLEEGMQHRFCSVKSLGHYLESTTKGMLTSQCYNSIVSNGLPLPPNMKVTADFGYTPAIMTPEFYEFPKWVLFKLRKMKGSLLKSSGRVK